MCVIAALLLRDQRARTRARKIWHHCSVPAKCTVPKQGYVIMEKLEAHGSGRSGVGSVVWVGGEVVGCFASCGLRSGSLAAMRSTARYLCLLNKVSSV